EPGVEQRLDEPRPESAVFLGSGTVVRVVVARDHVERRTARNATAFVRDDLLEPPVRIGAAAEMDRRRRKAGGFAHCRPEPRMPNVLLQSRGGASETDAGPAPGRVDVVGQGDGETGFRVGGNAKSPAQPFQGRIERVEARPLGAEAPMLVARARVLLLDPRQVEEALGEVIALRTLPTGDSLPRVRVVGHVVLE